MISIENETRGAAPRCFGPLGFVFLLLALSFGSLASNAASQVLKGNAGRTACRVTGINLKTGVVTASVIVEERGVAGSNAGRSSQSFRFLVKDSALLRSLKDGQEIFADFNAQLVFTSAGVRLGSILTDNSGRSLGGAAGQQCLVGNACNTGLVCSNNVCVAGGAAGQPCLSGSVCSSGLVCSNGVCATAQCPGGVCSCNSAADCPADQACDPNRHACTSTCSATAPCNGGCCQQNGLCGPGTSNNACGGRGGTCAVCGGNTPICTSAIGGGVCTASAQGTTPKAPAGLGGGSNPQPNETRGGTNPAGPAGGTSPPQKIGGTTPPGPIGDAKLGNAPNPGTAGQPKTQSAPVAPGGSPGAMKGAGPPINTPAPAQIQNFAVFPGPVLGGQNDLARVDLTGVPPSGATVQISSDHPSVASVSAPVQVPSQGTAAVVVKTQPVLQSTDVLLSAQVAGNSQVVTAKLTVRPPQVSFLSCLPNTMPSGTPIPCKVILEGPAPGISVTNAKTGSTSSAVARGPAAHQSGMLVQVSTNNSQVASVPGGGVLVPSGASSAQFELPTTAYPEPVDVIISASYPGSPSQTATVTLTAAAIRTFGCVQGSVPAGTVGAESCETVTDKSNTSIVINFSGPTPIGFVTVSSDSQALSICDGLPNGTCNHQSVTLPAQTGVLWERRGVWPNGVLVPTTATLSAQDPLSKIVKTVQIKVDPPSPTSIQFRSSYNAPFVTAISGVLIGGQQIQAVVRMNSSWPAGLTFDLKYTASDAAGNPLPGAISGPPQIVLSTSNADPALQYCFDITGITVQPCEVNAPCKVSVTVGTVTGTLAVNP